MSKRFLITGGAGFIGSAVVRRLIRDTSHQVLVVDKLTYAGNLDSLKPVSNSERFAFEQADIADPAPMRAVIGRFQPDVIMHLAAESHVDRSIDGPGEFVTTNVVGTFTLLQAALAYWRGLDAARRDSSTRNTPISRTRRIRPRRRPPIISSALGTTPTGCRP